MKYFLIIGVTLLCACGKSSSANNSSVTPQAEYNSGVVCSEMSKVYDRLNSMNFYSADDIRNSEALYLYSANYVKEAEDIFAKYPGVRLMCPGIEAFPANGVPDFSTDDVRKVMLELKGKLQEQH